MKNKLLLMVVALFVGFFAFNEVEAKLICEYDKYTLVFNSGDTLDNTVVYLGGKKLNSSRLDINVNFKESSCPKKIYIDYVSSTELKIFNYEQPNNSTVITKTLTKEKNFSPELLTCAYGKYEIIFDMSDDDEESTIVYTEGKTLTYPDTEVGFSEKKCSQYIYTFEINGRLIIDDSTNGYLDTPEEKILLSKVSCGSGEGMITGIPTKIPELTSFAITVIQIAVPIILVIMGSLDLFKGITAGKEDEMKKGQQMFIKRLAVGAIIFLVVIVVKFLISVVADTNVSNMVDCIDCFVSNDC